MIFKQKLFPFSVDGSLAGYLIKCPACKDWHTIHTEKLNDQGARWHFDGNMEAPTFNPSIKIDWHSPDGKVQCCHFTIAAGQISYCGDSTHDLAGKVVAMVDWE